ncbi:hypothetical protein [Oryza sativa Japonica Group]|uniref:Uncharacterized protein n=1 Tax=Oryza sativa subsp. japonica TaxID=39947 RepID=Q5QLZ6_ORYSJ|nr:hypothetical protein [Oryza sativa Japonica Group]
MRPMPTVARPYRGAACGGTTWRRRWPFRRLGEAAAWHSVTTLPRERIGNAAAGQIRGEAAGRCRRAVAGVVGLRRAATTLKISPSTPLPFFIFISFSFLRFLLSFHLPFVLLPYGPYIYKIGELTCRPKSIFDI